MSFDNVFDTFGNFGETPIFFFCDHATASIPREFHNLGLDERYLRTHIALDIGAKDLTLSLAETFGARAICSDFSRLLVDPNRSMDRADHIPEVSDGIEIPGNSRLSATDREERITRFFEPYHLALAEEIDAAQAAFDDPLIVSVHSFTPRLHVGHEDRPWHIGVLWAHDEPTARGFIAAARARAPEYEIGDNKPYDARGFNYTIDRHIKPLGLRHLTLEIRQDLLLEDDSARAMSRLLAAAIGDLMEREPV
jgi:predicted N-formylglutamate amidohydrolase